MFSAHTLLFVQALVQLYGQTVAGADFPIFAGSSATVSAAGVVTVSVAIKGSISGEAVQLTATAPLAATQSSTLGKGISVPRNECIAGYIKAGMPCDCGYPCVVVSRRVPSRRSVARRRHCGERSVPGGALSLSMEPWKLLSMERGGR